jgi:hypothetical protein
MGGETVDSNLTVLCSLCNKRKRDKPWDVFWAEHCERKALA